MQNSPSKESLVYHESHEQMSDSEIDPFNQTYGSTNVRTPGNSNDNLFSSTNTSNTNYFSATPSSPTPYMGIGVSNRKDLRRRKKMDRIGSVRTIEESIRSTDGHKSFFLALYHMITDSYINILLLAMPVAYWSQRQGWSPSSVFLWNFTAMVPLAALLGAFTEEVAAHTNQTIGGLINATFGNAVEVVVAIQALLAGEIRVVQASMIGSIFSNLLLVLGCCFFFGGLKYKEQHFQSITATANMGMLCLSSIALVLPTPFANYYDLEDEDALGISRTAAIFLISMYIQLLIFQLKTHADLFEDEEEEETEMSFFSACFGLVGVTTIIAKLSDYLVESIDGFCIQSGLSRTFVGLIILPIVGNAVEHATAVTVAMKDKMDLAMGVAVGSSVQISLFVAPLTVVVGWMVDKPMSFNFPHFEIILFTLSVIVVSITVANSKSNWLEGSMLITTYLMIAVGFYYEKIQDSKPVEV